MPELTGSGLMDEVKEQQPVNSTLPALNYVPSAYDIIDKYEDIETVYNEILGTAKVWLVKKKPSETFESDGKYYIKKAIQKNKLFGDEQLHHAR